MSFSQLARLGAIMLALAACAPQARHELDGGWLVQTIAGAPLAAPERIYFTADTQSGAVRGFTGCNEFSARIQVFGANVTIGHITEAEDAPCPSIAAQANETRFLIVLSAVARYARRGKSLELLARDAQPDALLRLRVDDFAMPAGAR